MSIFEPFLILNMLRASLVIITDPEDDYDGETSSVLKKSVLLRTAAVHLE